MNDLERAALKVLEKRPLHRFEVFEWLPLLGITETPSNFLMHDMASKGWVMCREDGRWTLTNAGRKALEAGQ